MASKDYTSISPSARSLVALKAATQIPFAKEAAALLIRDGHQGKESDRDPRTLFKLLIHFENRYQTIEKIVDGISGSNFMEISSGYSFRGLDYCLRHPVHFIDTDLDEIVSTKKNMVGLLLEEKKAALKGILEILPLNVLEEDLFIKTVARFSPGPLTILNEGLLVYLDIDEKTKLCSIIHRILRERGGYWITGDIYIKKENDDELPVINESFETFRKIHKIDENKFDSFDSAEQFFQQQGFEIVRKESLALERLSCLEKAGDRKEAVINQLLTVPKSRETWCLKAANS